MRSQDEKLVLREGRDWMELRKVGPGSGLWLVTGGTVGMAGDIVRVPRLGWIDPTADPDAVAEISPFEAEIVVDSVTRTVLLPESGQPFDPRLAAIRLVQTLDEAGLDLQARIVREWLDLTKRRGKTNRNAA